MIWHSRVGEVMIDNEKIAGLLLKIHKSLEMIILQLIFIACLIAFCA